MDARLQLHKKRSLRSGKIVFAEGGRTSLVLLDRSVAVVTIAAFPKCYRCQTSNSCKDGEELHSKGICLRD